MNDKRSIYLVHIFAIAHAVIVLLCYAFTVRDELLLTMATISMITLIGIRNNQNTGVIAISVIAGNILGYTFGTYGAKVVALFVEQPAIIHATTTFCFTEIMGWGLLLLYSALNRGKKKELSGRWTPDVVQLLLIISAILLARIAYSYTFGELLEGDSVSRMIRMFFGNSFAVTIMICTNIVYVILLDKYTSLHRAWLYIGMTLVQSVVMAIISALIIGYDFPFLGENHFSEVSFIQLSAITFLANIVIYIIVILIYQLQKTRHRILREREKRHLAQFRYNMLKQQMNPHFLFNSLNILNGLIEEQQTEQAEEYVRKLASLYRYVMKTEDEELVSVGEEMEFTMQYLDLLRVRFQQGFVVESNMTAAYRNRSVVPCGIQLLIENAFKHNVVHKDNPLHIEIIFSDDKITVRNNRQPKLSPPDSTNLGLKNLSQQYRNIAGCEIIIEQNEESYQVALPLI